MINLGYNIRRNGEVLFPHEQQLPNHSLETNFTYIGALEVKKQLEELNPGKSYELVKITD